MLGTIAAVLIVLWILGFSTHVMGSLIHIFLIAAVALILINIIRGRTVA